METLTVATSTSEDYGGIPLGAEASVFHVLVPESDDQEDRTELREIRSLDAWRG